MRRPCLLGLIRGPDNVLRLFSKAFWHLEASQVLTWFRGDELGSSFERRVEVHLGWFFERRCHPVDVSWSLCAQAVKLDLSAHCIHTSLCIVDGGAKNIKMTNAGIGIEATSATLTWGA